MKLNDEQYKQIIANFECLGREQRRFETTFVEWVRRCTEDSDMWRAHLKRAVEANEIVFRAEQRLATIEESQGRLLACLDDIYAKQGLLFKQVDALSAQISGGFDGTVDGYNRVAEELKQLTAAVRIFAVAVSKPRTKRRSKKSLTGRRNAK